jgi:tetratricopeptide (TPR) repeat protein
MIATLLLATTLTAAAAKTQWNHLMEARKVQQAKALCMTWIASSDRAIASQGHQCLASVAAGDAQSMEIEGTKSGGFIGEGFRGPHVDEALGHLDLAIALTPDDLSIHQGRLFMLTHSGRLHDAPAALEKSLAVYQGPDALQAWLGYCPEFADREDFDDAVAYMRVLEKKYPNDPDVVSNIGAFLFMGKKYETALPYVKRGAELAPHDPINIWNLGRIYDRLGNNELAEKSYRAGMKLETDAAALRDKKCMFAEFLEKRGDKTNAAKYRDGNDCGQ